MTDQTRYTARLHNLLRQALADIPTQLRGGIYAVSLYFHCEDDDDRYPCVGFSYNTESRCREQAAQASSPAEARWNYAYWLQEDAPAWRIIGGENDADLAAWFAASPHYYGEEENQAAFEDDDDEAFATVSAKGDTFRAEFVEAVIAAVQKLFAENAVADTFGRDIPVLVHELEYYDLPNGWTKRANPPGVADEFLAWAQNGGYGGEDEDEDARDTDYR